jgi:hypothetical protein
MQITGVTDGNDDKSQSTINASTPTFGLTRSSQHVTSVAFLSYKVIFRFETRYNVVAGSGAVLDSHSFII